MISTQEIKAFINMLYNYEPGIVKLIQKFMTTYTFKTKEKLQEAVNMWCNKEMF